jgi:DNA-binding transcriptional MerR regulator
MVQQRPLESHDREPLFNIRAVSQETGVPADTIRAWERRYGFPRPQRTPTNQRRYSARDLAAVSWLLARTNEGMAISQAVQRLRIEHPETFRVEQVTTPAPRPSPRNDSRAALRERLVEALVDVDGLAAERVFDEALARFSIEEVCLSIVEGALVQIGEHWERGLLPAGVEHFATRLVTRRLSLLFNQLSPPVGRGRIVATCAPGEEHELGLLMLSIFVARRGWSVVFLGGGVPLDDLIETIDYCEPDCVCLSASRSDTARTGLEAAAKIAREINPPPAIAYGGRAFSLPELRGRQPLSHAHYLHGSPDHIAEQLAMIVEHHKETTHRR